MAAKKKAAKKKGTKKKAAKKKGTRKSAARKPPGKKPFVIRIKNGYPMPDTTDPPLGAGRKVQFINEDGVSRVPHFWKSSPFEKDHGAKKYGLAKKGSAGSKKTVTVRHNDKKGKVTYDYVVENAKGVIVSSGGGPQPPDIIVSD